MFWKGIPSQEPKTLVGAGRTSRSAEGTTSIVPDKAFYFCHSEAALAAEEPAFRIV
jgi:hypothetical protein